jgi:hypothetical protein
VAVTDSPLYKVLVDGKSCHGGQLEWSLPKKRGRGWTPGEWHRYDGKLRICETGIHLTNKPDAWLRPGCEIYRADADGIHEWEGDKCVARAARLLRPEPKPAYWLAVEKFLRDELPTVKWFKPDGKPLPQWKLFTAPAWDAAEDAAWDAARDAAWNAAWDAARGAAEDAAWNAARGAAEDAAWGAARGAAWNAAWNAAEDAAWNAARGAADFCVIERLCADLEIAEIHRAHIRARWEVWLKGYAVLCDVDGVLYVYAAEGAK